MRFREGHDALVDAEVHHVLQDGFAEDVPAAGIELSIAECAGPAFAEQHVGMFVEFSFGEEPADVAETLLDGFSLLVQIYGKSATQQVEGCPQPCGARAYHVHMACHRDAGGEFVVVKRFPFPRGLHEPSSRILASPKRSLCLENDVVAPVRMSLPAAIQCKPLYLEIENFFRVHAQFTRQRSAHFALLPEGYFQFSVAVGEHYPKNKKTGARPAGKFAAGLLIF